jgi:autotransporter translocation and assembly factor TamB
MRKILLLGALLALPLLAHAATDITGTWQVKVDLSGQSGAPTFVLKQDADKLTGKYSGAFGEADMKGTIQGDDVTLDFEASGIAIHYQGKLNSDGTKIEGTCDYGGQASGTFTATKSAVH